MNSAYLSNDYVENAVKHYSSLFGLPSYRRLLYLLLASCIGFGVVSGFLLRSSYYGLVDGLVFAAFLFLFNLAFDFLAHHLWMKNDPVFNLRRCSALSLFSNLIWLVALILCGILNVAFGNPFFSMKLLIPGFSAALVLRLMVFCTTSTASLKGAFMSSIVQPFLFISPLFYLGVITGHSLEGDIAVLLLLSVMISSISVFFFIHFINKIGKTMLEMDTLLIFKSFVANWLENVGEPLETIFEKFGIVKDIKISMLAFRSKQKLKALMLVPTFHSGPFKNVGSSLLSFHIQKVLEKRLGCVVSIFHGTSGHESDIASQKQNQKVLDSLQDSTEFSSFSSKASPLLRMKQGDANVGCQVFGDLVLLALTLSPKTTEDLPSELNDFALSEAKNRGFSSAIVVDAHNSINGPPNIGETVEALENVSLRSIREVSQISRLPFEVGSARIVPQSFSLKEGMGPGGIVAIVTKVGDQKTAYVTIDGNNMVSGLREKILSALQQIGITDGEILTTDTHAVNGIALVKRGYHPIGEVMDQEQLIGCVKQTVQNALKDMELAEVSHQTHLVPDVKVVGEKQVSDLCLLTEKAAKEAKRLAISIFLPAGVILAVLLLLM